MLDRPLSNQTANYLRICSRRRCATRSLLLSLLPFLLLLLLVHLYQLLLLVSDGAPLLCQLIDLFLLVGDLRRQRFQWVGIYLRIQRVRYPEIVKQFSFLILKGRNKMPPGAVGTLP